MRKIVYGMLFVMAAATVALVKVCNTPTKSVQIQTCQWPHKCVFADMAQVQTCVWPHTCVKSM
jgi:hypothetical protein